MDIKALEAHISTLDDELTTLFAANARLIPVKKNVLRDALKNQVDLKLDYERLKARADYYEKVAEAIKEQNHSYAFGKYMTQSAKMYNGSDARKMADCDADYIAAVKVYNSAYKLRKEIDAIHNTITERNFTLKDIVACVNNGTADHII